MHDAATPDHADVVIIGGGITGCSVAYHLAERGRTSVVLDKGPLADGSTHRSAGLVTHFCADPLLGDLVAESVSLYDRLAGGEGPERGWHRVGSLRLASSTERLAHMRRILEQVNARGIHAGTISTAETLRLFPLMTFKDLYGAVYLPTDGYADAPRLTRALAREAEQRGARFFPHQRVTGIERSAAGDVKGVYTSHGLLKADVVVLAAGIWSARLAAMVDVRLPLTPVLHPYVVTGPIDGPSIGPGAPVLRDPDRGFYLRALDEGVLVGGFGPHPVAWTDVDAPWEYTNASLPADRSALDEVLQSARRRVPLLRDTTVRETVNGPEAVTPDGQYYLGPVAACPGLFVAAGASFNGVAAAGGVGRVVADWIVDGSPSINARPVAADRFEGRFTAPEEAARHACRIYAETFRIPS